MRLYPCFAPPPSSRWNLRILLVSTLLLTACNSLLPPPRPAPLLHDLGPVAGEPVALPWQLGIQIGAPPWLDNGAVHYRLAGDTHLAAYRDHRWAAPPSALLTRRLRARMAPPQPDSPTHWLDVEIRVFEQRFTAAGDASAHLEARALLRARRGGALLASRDFILHQPAPSADVHGGLTALASAADGLATALLEWLVNLPPAPPSE